MSIAHEVVIASACRTTIGSFMGGLSEIPPAMLEAEFVLVGVFGVNTALVSRQVSQ